MLTYIIHNFKDQSDFGSRNIGFRNKPLKHLCYRHVFEREIEGNSESTAHSDASGRGDVFMFPHLSSNFGTIRNILIDMMDHTMKIHTQL